MEEDTNVSDVNGLTSLYIKEGDYLITFLNSSLHAGAGFSLVILKEDPVYGCYNFIDAVDVEFTLKDSINGIMHANIKTLYEDTKKFVIEKDILTKVIQYFNRDKEKKVSITDSNKPTLTPSSGTVQ